MVKKTWHKHITKLLKCKQIQMKTEFNVWIKTVMAYKYN